MDVTGSPPVCHAKKKKENNKVCLWHGVSASGESIESEM